MLKFVSWNIHRCIGTDGAYRPSRIRSVLRTLDADIIALQEVEQFRNDPGLLQFLCEGSAWQAVPGITMIRESGHYGNAVLSRVPIQSVERVDLSVPGREPRGAIDLRLAAGTEGAGMPCRVLATHLGLAPRERRQQANRLGELLEHQALSPIAGWTVLMGDFNEWLLWGRPLRRLRRYFPRSPAPRTFPSRHPLFALDRVWLAGPPAQLSITAVNTPETRRASDHLPLLARLVPASESGVP